MFQNQEVFSILNLFANPKIFFPNKVKKKKSIWIYELILVSNLILGLGAQSMSAFS